MGTVIKIGQIYHNEKGNHFLVTAVDAPKCSTELGCGNIYTIGIEYRRKHVLKINYSKLRWRHKLVGNVAECPCCKEWPRIRYGDDVYRVECWCVEHDASDSDLAKAVEIWKNNLVNKRKRINKRRKTATS